jgi:hypothetical protein
MAMKPAPTKSGNHGPFSHSPTRNPRARGGGVVQDGGGQNAQDDRDRPAEPRRQHHGSSWVLSPISATATTPVEMRKAST